MNKMVNFVNDHQCYPIAELEVIEKLCHHNMALLYYFTTILKNLDLGWRLPHPSFEGNLAEYIEAEWRFQLGWALEVHRLHLELIRACVSGLPPA